MSESSRTWIHVVTVQDADGCRDHVTLVPPAVAFAEGLVAEAIVGTLGRPLRVGERISPLSFAPG